MNYEIVKEIPLQVRKTYRLGKIQSFLMEFMNTDAKIIKIDALAEGYKSARYLANNLYSCGKGLGLRITVHQRGDYVYVKKMRST